MQKALDKHIKKYVYIMLFREVKERLGFLVLCSYIYLFLLFLYFLAFMLNEWSMLKSVQVISTDQNFKVFFYFKSSKLNRQDV